MSSLSEIEIAAVNAGKPFPQNETSNFRRRTLSNSRCTWPRRYVMALMLFALLLIYTVRHLNVAFTLLYIIAVEEDNKVEYQALGNWTIAELENLTTFLQVGDIFANLLGALLIFQYSSYKFLLVTVTVSSILHMLTPAALNHHSVSFLLIVMTSQGLLSAPVYSAVLSMWKDWSPPAERFKLVTFSLCGKATESVIETVCLIVFPYVSEYFCYYAGIAGLIWALLWYNIVSDTPQNDPLISEKEYLYLQSTIPSNIQEKIKIKDVPWVPIMKSIQVFILCLIFFKVSCSLQTMLVAGIFFIFTLSEVETNPLIYFLPLLAVFMALLVVSSSLLDFLIKRKKYMALKIRKCLLCFGFGLQSLLVLGAFSNVINAKAVFYILSYSAFAFSLPGVLTYALDLSPRYVSLVAGVGFASFSLGTLCFQYIIEHSFSWMGLHSISVLFILDAVMSICAAIAFGVWGDVEEQRWSLIFSSKQHGTDYKSYPQPDDEDDIHLVS